MYSFHVVIEVDDSKRERGGVKNVSEFYVAESFEEVYEKAVASTKRWDGLLMGVIRKDPILGIILPKDKNELNKETGEED